MNKPRLHQNLIVIIQPSHSRIFKMKITKQRSVKSKQHQIRLSDLSLPPKIRDLLRMSTLLMVLWGIDYSAPRRRTASPSSPPSDHEAGTQTILSDAQQSWIQLLLSLEMTLKKYFMEHPFAKTTNNIKIQVYKTDRQNYVTTRIAKKYQLIVYILLLT